MGRGSSFNSVVAGRTSAASKILNTAELLRQFEESGGLKADLEAIVAHGKEAEALNQSQGAATREKSVATAKTLEAFQSLQREYSAIMDVLVALRAELTNAGEKDNLKRLNGIIASETETAFTEKDAGDGKTVKKARKSQTQEATRAEIARDAKSLLDFTAIASRLAARRVDATRLQALKTNAEALAGKLADRVATAAERKALTEKEQAAVAAQNLHWTSSRRLLSALAKRDVRALDLVNVIKQ